VRNAPGFFGEAARDVTIGIQELSYLLMNIFLGQPLGTPLIAPGAAVPSKVRPGSLREELLRHTA
jgi:hypothetical protein